MKATELGHLFKPSSCIVQIVKMWDKYVIIIDDKVVFIKAELY